MPTQLWTTSEVNLLTQNYRAFTYRQIGSILGKSEDAVKQKAVALGLRKLRSDKRVNQVWSEHDIRELERLYPTPGLTVLAMSEILNKTVGQIYAKAWRLGLTHVNQNGRPLKTKSSRRRKAA